MLYDFGDVSLYAYVLRDTCRRVGYDVTIQQALQTIARLYALPSYYRIKAHTSPINPSTLNEQPDSIDQLSATRSYTGFPTLAQNLPKIHLEYTQDICIEFMVLNSPTR
ncbi:hypothetical protein HBI23_046520 [Parastagonospora nodorum]|nr:hypothetical protein HBI23_046520 [Parastagonospora nodorum]